MRKYDGWGLGITLSALLLLNGCTQAGAGMTQETTSTAAMESFCPVPEPQTGHT